VALGLPGLTAAAMLRSESTDPHNSSCPACHRGEPKPGAAQLTRDISRVCVDCHARSKATSHPVGMVPSMTVPDDLHLDARGRMTCATCHDTHQVRTGDHALYPSLLRRPQAGRALCVACHRTMGAPNAKVLHSLVEASAHRGPRLLRDDSGAGFIDRVSMECLGCHDGSVATGGQTMAAMGGLFDHGGEVGVTHPIGMDYARSAMLNRSLAPAQELDPAVRLFGGMVGCCSCHDPFSTSKHQLVMDNAGSKLCLQCHRM
jgi:predicted CXXCH cytochrome family protein